MFKFVLKKKKYLNCPYLKHSLHFFYDEIRACCSNVKGPVFYQNYDGKQNINFDFIYNERKKYIKKINSSFNNGYIPNECERCYLIKNFLTDKKIENFENKINTIFIQNNMSCNAKCIYCVFAEIERGQKYEVVPIIKALYEKNLIDKNSEINLSGGEITISSDFEELIGLLNEHSKSQFFILTSGIKYSPAIENAFKMNKCWQTISLDSGTKETYKKIKNVDCFEKVINNLQRYIKSSSNAQNCNILKYILVDNINDNKEEIDKFFNIINFLGVKNVRIDVNYEIYNSTNDRQVPKKQIELIEYFNETAKKYNINALTNEQTIAILNKNVELKY